MDWKDRLTRFAGPQAKTGERRQWYRIQNAAHADEADVYIYDAIDSWWGVSAQQFATEIGGITAKTLNVHINSPGGSAFDGLAIFQSLRNHPARIVTYVDSLAASAASFIAMAGDKRVVSPYANVMIHDAWALAIGDAAVMGQARDDLNRLSDTLASLYANRSGVGDKADWRAAMLAETWYSAQEAVDAGLMQEIQEDAEKGTDHGGASNQFDLSIFNFAGRDQAPAPRIPAAMAKNDSTGRTARNLAPTVPDTDEEEGDNTVYEPELPLDPPEPDDGPAPQMSGAEPEAPSDPEPKESPVATLSTDVLTRLGLTDADADDHAVLARIDELKAKAETPPKPEPDPERAAVMASLEDKNAELVKEVSVLASKVEGMSAELAATKAERAAAEKKAILDTAQALGKFKPADRAQWEEDYDEAPAAITRTLARIAEGTEVPTQPVGHAGDGDTDMDAEWERTMARLDGPVTSKGN